jgi:AcrR family transcriptional regulator
VADRRIERGRATRERLIAAGRILFGERGYEATSIEAILAAAGVAKGALYHHFATKAELFDAVLERLVAEMAETVTEAARRAGDSVGALRAGCAAWLEMALDPQLQRIGLIDAPAVVGWTRCRELDERYSLGALRTNLRQISDDGRLPPEQVDVFAHMVIASVTEAALMIARSDDPEATLGSARAAVDALIDGLVSGR